MELNRWDLCESLSSILSVQSPKGWRPPFLRSTASVHRTKSTLLFVPIKKSTLLFVLVIQSTLLFDLVSPLPAATSLLASSESRGSIGGEGRAHVELHLWGVGGHILAVASRPPRGGLGRL